MWAVQQLALDDESRNYWHPVWQWQEMSLEVGDDVGHVWLQPLDGDRQEVLRQLVRMTRLSLGVGITTAQPAMEVIPTSERFRWYLVTMRQPCEVKKTRASRTPQRGTRGWRHAEWNWWRPPVMR